jgi:hypothetical protein
LTVRSLAVCDVMELAQDNVVRGIYGIWAC